MKIIPESYQVEPNQVTSPLPVVSQQADQLVKEWKIKGYLHPTDEDVKEQYGTPGAIP